MTPLGQVLGWKHNHAPGITTKDDKLVNWPPGLGPRPDAAQIATWTAQYEALPVDGPARNPRADRLARTRAANSVPELRAIVEELI